MRTRGLRRVAAPPATSRHPNHSLPLLPSGPGGICKLSSREDRRSHRENCRDPAGWERDAGTARDWRRERDSNPRNGFPFTHFPGVLLQPLGHLSARTAPLRGPRSIPAGQVGYKRKPRWGHHPARRRLETGTAARVGRIDSMTPRLRGDTPRPPVPPLRLRRPPSRPDAASRIRRPRSVRSSRSARAA
jgi:hypothetical protein